MKRFLITILVLSLIGGTSNTAQAGICRWVMKIAEKGRRAHDLYVAFRVFRMRDLELSSMVAEAREVGYAVEQDQDLSNSLRNEISDKFGHGAFLKFQKLLEDLQNQRTPSTPVPDEFIQLMTQWLYSSYHLANTRFGWAYKGRNAEAVRKEILLDMIAALEKAKTDENTEIIQEDVESLRREIHYSENNFRRNQNDIPVYLQEIKSLATKLELIKASYPTAEKTAEVEDQKYQNSPGVIRVLVFDPQVSEPVP